MIGSVGAALNAARSTLETALPEWAAWIMLAGLVALVITLVWAVVSYYRTKK